LLSAILVVPVPRPVKDAGLVADVDSPSERPEPAEPNLLVLTSPPTLLF
jgi:hypothetical protein